MHSKKILLIAILLVSVCGIGLISTQRKPLQKLLPSLKSKQPISLMQPTAFVQAPNSIEGLTFTANGKLLLAADSNNDVTVWDTESKTQLKTLAGIGSINWASQDRNSLLYVTNDYVLKNGDQKLISHLTYLHFAKNDLSAKDAINTVEMKHFSMPGRITDALPDLSKVLLRDTQSDDELTYSFSLLDTHSEKVLSRTFTKNKQDDALIPQFLHDANYIFITRNGLDSLLLNTVDLSTYRKFRPLQSIQFSKDHQYLVGADRHGNIYSWNLKTQEYLHHDTLFDFARGLFPTNKNTFIMSGSVGDKENAHKESAEFSAQGKFLRHVKYVDPVYAKLKKTWITARRGYNENARYSEDAKKPYLDVLNVSTGKVTHHLDVLADAFGNERAWNPSPSYSENISTTAPDGSRAAFSTPDGLIRFYDLKSPKPQNLLQYKSTSEGYIPLFDDTHIPNTKLIDGQMVSTADQLPVFDNYARPKATVQYPWPKRMDIAGHPYKFQNRSISPDATKALIAWEWNKYSDKPDASPYYNNFDVNILELRNSKDGALIRKLDLPPRFYPHVSQDSTFWTNNNQYVAFYDRAGGINLYDVETGLQKSYFSGNMEQSEAGSLYAKNGNSGYKYFSKPINQTTAIDVMPNGNYLALARDDNSVYLYSLKTRLPVAQIGKAKSWVSRLQFSKDGKTLYAVTGGKVHAWKIPVTLQ